jgi:hypothetical protein
MAAEKEVNGFRVSMETVCVLISRKSSLLLRRTLQSTVRLTNLVGREKEQEGEKNKCLVVGHCAARIPSRT